MVCLGFFLKTVFLAQFRGFGVSPNEMETQKDTVMYLQTVMFNSNPSYGKAMEYHKQPRH